MADLSERVRASLAGRYTIERELGRGGMATVYLARDLKHDRPVALSMSGDGTIELPLRAQAPGSPKRPALRTRRCKRPCARNPLAACATP